MGLMSAVRIVVAVVLSGVVVFEAPAQSIVVTDENQVRHTNGAAPGFLPVSTFPDTQVSITQSITYRIYNDSPLPLTISNIQTLGPFQVTTAYETPADLNIEPFGTTFATLRARPDVAGSYNIQVTITSNSTFDSTFVLNLEINATTEAVPRPDLDMKFFTNIAAKYKPRQSIIDLKIKGVASNLGEVATTGDSFLVYRTHKRYFDDSATLLGMVPIKKLPLAKPGKPAKAKKVKFKGQTEISESTIYLVLLPGTMDDSDWSNNVASMFYRVAVP